MLRACGRGPRYPGKLIARAIELYLNGVKPGYIRWHELQSILQKEFPSEFPAVADDLPSPETVLDWVRKFPDAPERIRELKAQEFTRGEKATGTSPHQFGHQPQPAVPTPYARVTSSDMNALLGNLIALMAMAIMVRFAWSLIRI